MNALQITSRGAAPSLARTASPRAGWMSRAGHSLYSALLASGQARARAELETLADRWETLHPSLATELRAACAHIANP